MRLAYNLFQFAGQFTRIQGFLVITALNVIKAIKVYRLICSCENLKTLNNANFFNFFSDQSTAKMSFLGGPCATQVNLTPLNS